MKSSRQFVLVSRSLVGLFAVLVSVAGLAHAQVRVDATLNEETYLKYESVKVAVKISNRSGDDLYVGGSNAVTRLSFQVRDMKGNMIRSTEREPLPDKAWLVPNNKASQLEFNLLEFRSVYRPGTYVLRVSVINGKGDNAEAYVSADVQFTISSGTQYEKIERKKSDRTFVLLGLRRNGGYHMLLRVTDYKEELCYGTYYLEKHLKFVPPEMRLADDGGVHTLHYLSPERAVHCIFGPKGSPKDRLLYQVTPGPRTYLVPAGETGFVVPNARLLNGDK